MRSDKLNRFSHEVIAIMPLMIREYARREDNDLTRGKISCPQMAALDYVAQKECVKMHEVAKVLGTRMSSATTLVDRLIRDKMLDRRRDEKDRRVVWVSATAKARKVIAQIMEQKRASIKAVFGGLSDKERDQYLSVLLKVKANLLKNQELQISDKHKREH